MSIRHFFPKLADGDREIDFKHLAPFTHSLQGHGRNGASIVLRVSFRSHVFSRAHKGETQGLFFLDENGNRRIFCEDRYAASLQLPALCLGLLSSNALTWESRDGNEKYNLASIGGALVSGAHDTVIFYLFPSGANGIDVEFVVVSFYLKTWNFAHVKRRDKIIQPIKKCYYNGHRVPK
ncbi:hypothetical protein [Pleomorphomonas sp. JP5]|uniref:hypothetical protein n=1 Tax=Pleomorphomonas sp. JP5 TaxID=2942998 RepID=UPI0020449CE3|nr:hypothetical protein [Pleomorphomonas sp. JP5]MCM5557057.1 hypothetical protein [Pleomorphomonas sp. JP5]